LRLKGNQRASNLNDIARGQKWWSERFSAWPDWTARVKSTLLSMWGTLEDAAAALAASAKGKTCLVFGGGGYGWLAHPNARIQENIMEKSAVDGELAMCVAAVMVVVSGSTDVAGEPNPGGQGLLKFFGKRSDAGDDDANDANEVGSSGKRHKVNHSGDGGGGGGGGSGDPIVL